jgi:hypothetical protein
MDINSIDNCISGSHYNISLYIFEKIKNKHKYNTDNNEWFYLNNNNEWIIDNKLNNLIIEIKSKIVNDFILRSIYLNDIKNNNNDDNVFKSNKLLEIANKLKNDKFIKDIIKEIKQFY